MTPRAVILGVLGATVIVALGYLIGHVLELASFTDGGLLASGVLLMMLIGAGGIAVLKLFRVRGRFRPGELAVIVGLLLAACSVLGGAVLPTLTPALAMPAYYNELRPGWKKHQLLSYVTPSMLPADAKYDSEVIAGFLGGLGSSDSSIPLSGVPWDKWSRPLITWIPLLSLAGVCMGSLSLIVHRQWSERERLRYPIAEVATALLSGRMQSTRRRLYTDGMFLAGFGIVFAVFFINGLQKWYPGSIRIPMIFNFWQIPQKFPILYKAPFADHLVQVRISPTAIAFGFLLASDVSLSLGLSQFIFVPIGIWALAMGVDLKSDYMEGGATAWQRFGSYLAFGLMLLYFGRRYYWRLLVRALTFRKRGDVTSYETWACRAFVLSAAAMFIIICRLGLDWTLGLLTVGMLLLLFVVVSRIGAETGLFTIQARWQPLGIFLGLLGVYALGPQGIIIVGLICTVVALNPGYKLMPFLVNALKIGSNLQVRPGRLAIASSGVYVLGICLAITVTLWANYNFGITPRGDITVRAPTMSFRPADRAATKMKTANQLDASENLSPLQRLTNLRPKKMFLWAGGIGFVLVILFSAMRIRCPWWPLHPVLFLVCATWPMGLLSHSFLLGWFVRVVVMRIGGHEGYQRAKPFMIGAVAGNLLGPAVWTIVGMIYYHLTGIMPPK